MRSVPGWISTATAGTGRRRGKRGSPLRGLRQFAPSAVPASSRRPEPGVSRDPALPITAPRTRARKHDAAIQTTTAERIVWTIIAHPIVAFFVAYCLEDDDGSDHIYTRVGAIVLASVTPQSHPML